MFDQKVFSVAEKIAKEGGDGAKVRFEEFQGGDSKPTCKLDQDFSGLDCFPGEEKKSYAGDSGQGVEHIDHDVLGEVMLVLVGDVQDVVKVERSSFGTGSFLELRDDFRASEDSGRSEGSVPFPIVLVDVGSEVDRGVGEDDGGAEAE